VANTAVKSARDQSGGKNDAVRRNFASFDDIVKVAKEQVPGATPTRIQSSAGKNSGYMVWMHLPSDWRDEGDNRLLVDDNSAMLLGVQLGRDRAPSPHVIEGASASVRARLTILYDLPNIFDRFFRAENARLTAEAGSGLGLAIAQWIVDVHEARLNVESALGAGSTFRVKFRAQKQPAAGEGIRQDVAISLAASPS
jgi:hypothetical protein